MSATNQPPIRTGLLDFFRNTQGCQFVIPVYQRNYTWTSGKEVRQYLEDMENVLKGEYENHFLGIMIYLDKPIDYSAREFSVIDGQQRLTTTFLILYAVRELFRESGEIDQIQNLEGQYLTNPFSTAKLKYKLKPLVSDDEVFQYIVENKIDSITQKDSNVYKNYVYIKNYLENLIKNNYDLKNILMALNNLYVVCVPISENDNAQKIFESINATGVKLTASDLIRNFLLMDLPSDVQEKYFEQYWKQIETYVSNDSKKLELFFRFFLAVKNLTLPTKNEVYRLFVDWYKQKEKILNENDSICSEEAKRKVFEELVLYAEAYYVIYKKDLKDIDIIIQSSLKEYRRILSDMPAPFLMEFYIIYCNGLISAKTFSDLVQLINIYLIRRSLCDMDTSGITKMFPSLLKNVLNDCSDDYAHVEDVLVRDLVAKNIGNAMNMPNDQQLRDVVLNINMYNLRQTLRIIFDKLEHENNPAPVDLSSCSVEHLMPQTPTNEWLNILEVDIDTYQRNVHRLGNLTLAAKSDNSSMGNKVWEYKNEILKNTSHLKINERILETDQWNIKCIDDRTEELIDWICEAYPYPTIKNDIIPREEIFIKINEVNAKAYLSLDDGSVEIDVGSRVASYDNAESFPDVEDLRMELIEDGVICELEGVLQFVKPYTMYPKISNATALSAAASLILHGNKNGWQYWENKDGVYLKDLPEIRKLFKN